MEAAMALVRKQKQLEAKRDAEREEKYEIPPPLAKFLGLGEDTKLTIKEIHQKIWDYAKEKKIIECKVGKGGIIHPDEPLRDLFNLDEMQKITSMNLSSIIARLYPKTIRTSSSISS